MELVSRREYSNSYSYHWYSHSHSIAASSILAILVVAVARVDLIVAFVEAIIVVHRVGCSWLTLVGCFE